MNISAAVVHLNSCVFPLKKWQCLNALPSLLFMMPVTGLLSPYPQNFRGISFPYIISHKYLSTPFTQ